MHQPLGKNRIVLLGVGHTNAHVLKMWKMKPIDDTELVCVSNFPVATYSGMLPGVLAGQYHPSEMEIDLVRLCQSAGARLIIDKVNGLDHQRRQLLFDNRSPLDFDLLSIGIGSGPSFVNVDVHSETSLVTIKPMQTFLSRIDTKLNAIDATIGQAQVKRIVIVGGGVGSIEIAFCLNSRLGTRGRNNFEIALVTASSRVGNQLLTSTQSKVERALSEQNIDVLTDHRVSEIDANKLTFDNGTTQTADLILWATDASPPLLVAMLNLKLDPAGFVSVRPTLQSLEHDQIFSVGDSSTVMNSPTPKAGVYAVRQGPVLWQNLQRALSRDSLLDFQPQTGFLKLINTGDGKGIGEYRGFSFHNRLAWKLKNRIDTKFMAMYRNYEIPKMSPPTEPTEKAIRCLGCGGKIGAQVLRDVLNDLELPSHPDVIIGLNRPDDAAIVRIHDNQVTITTDFFASPFDDPYLIGRIAVLNSASDCFVMGAQPTAALAMVQLPVGHPRSQARIMRELMTGSLKEISAMGATIVGGHTIEGNQLTVGFTFIGHQLSAPKTKSDLCVGDQLILSKPLGTGVLLAALMRAQLPGTVYQPLIHSMLQSNQIALNLIESGLVTAITDVTGFGLVGHLSEMLMASQKSARIQLEQVPLLPLAKELLIQGLESSLAHDNRTLNEIDVCGLNFDDPRCSVLFDPQTSGGLLVGVRRDLVNRALNELQTAGFDRAVVIGEVIEKSSGRPALQLC